MLHYSLAERHNQLKQDIISTILFAFTSVTFPKGKYVFSNGDLTIIITEDGNDPIDFIEWDGSDIVFNTDNNCAVSLEDLYFEDLLYFYEILEGSNFVVDDVIEIYE